MAPITVLMTTLNGAVHLQAQLDSLLAQTMSPDRLIVSDDGSVDGTQDILRAFSRAAPFGVNLRKGPSAGVAHNMLSLLKRAPAGWLALADQDDVWLPHKLDRARTCLETVSPQIPALYAARRIITDATLTPRALSPLPCRAPDFANALIQNIAPGNTIVLNTAAAALARAAIAAIADIGDRPLPFHDWWLYQLVTGTGGQVVFDPEPTLYYRQHGSNLLGAGRGLFGRLHRLRTVFGGTYGSWMRAQATALACSAHRLSPAAQRQLCDTLTAFHARRMPIRDLGLFRQTAREQALFRAAALLGRI